jgi:hypothetical protein
LPPLSFYPVTGQERWEERLAEESMETKVELSSLELLSSFETQLTEPHMEDLIVSELRLFKNEYFSADQAKNENGSDIVETVDPAETIRT